MRGVVARKLRKEAEKNNKGSQLMAKYNKNGKTISFFWVGAVRAYRNAKKTYRKTKKLYDNSK